MDHGHLSTAAASTVTGDVLVLGGTAEARELANALDDAGTAVISSLAGRVSQPRLPAGEVRIGGFGGPEALAVWLVDNEIASVVDATHPFAERISASAVDACKRARVPLLRLERPGWSAQPGDNWHWVDDVPAAAERVAQLGRRVLLTTGRQGLGAFASVHSVWFLIRCVDPPGPPLPPMHEVILARGPYTLPGELALIDDHEIDLVVTKDSGGPYTVAKLEAARLRGVPVVIVRRPSRAGGDVVTDVLAAFDWVREVHSDAEIELIPGADHCPGISALHQAEDGWLARVRLPGGRISSGQLESIAELAKLGNGIVELTTRANVQIRGLPEDCGQQAAEQLAIAGLMPSDSHERVRNILASPLAGRHSDSLVSIDQLVIELDRSICANPRLAQLSGRFLFGIDDGSGVLVEEDFDVGLFAEHSNSTRAGQPLFRLVLGGVQTATSVTREDVTRAALNAALTFLAMPADGTERMWRVRDLPGGGQTLADNLALRTEDVSSIAGGESRPFPLGAREQNDGRWSVTALPPLGRLSSDAIKALSAVVALHGSDARLSPWRTVTIVDVSPTEVLAVTEKLERIGLQVEPSGWQGLSACAGLGACSKALADVRAAAEKRAKHRGPNAPAEHWSACEKRCGRPRGTAVNIHACGDRIVIDSDGERRETTSVGEAISLLNKGVRRE